MSRTIDLVKVAEHSFRSTGISIDKDPEERGKMHDDRERQAALKQAGWCCGWAVFAGVMAACCAVGLIVCGVVITKPVVETKSLEFQETTCTTEKGYLTGRSIRCGCGKDCSSTYPCLRMTVTYVVNNGTVDGVLFDTEQRLNSNGGSAENEQCATAPCQRDAGQNYRDVLNFNDTYPPGTSYTCLYHPDRPGVKCSADPTLHVGRHVPLHAVDQEAKNKVASIPVTIPPRAPGAQPGYFLPQPPAYSEGGQSMGMQPPPQNIYSNDTKTGYYNYN
ncbi:calcium-activated potassium channel subunit [Branchiostoma belcheri]|nr:calcium-activated potassium channel subunit [Branchiostoma belcheri]